MDVYETTLSRLNHGQSSVMATIIASEGSTPLPSGAKMLVDEHGTVLSGTVGGGRIEAEVQRAAAHLIDSGTECAMHHFKLSKDDGGIGMLCGGNVEVLLERVKKEHAGLYSELIDRREAGEDVAIVTVISEQLAMRDKYLSPPLTKENGGVSDSLEEVIHGAIRTQSIRRVSLAEAEAVVEPLAGIRDLIIFGGGHISRHLSRSAAMAGFRVTIIDDREEFAARERFPDAYKTLALDFDAAWDRLTVKPPTSIVIVTRGHNYDEKVLERAVHTPAGYIGMIGSKRKVIETFKSLASRGVSQETLRHVYAPIGLAIGAVTAEEIAISITAELIAARRGKIGAVRTMADVKDR